MMVIVVVVAVIASCCCCCCVVAELFLGHGNLYYCSDSGLWLQRRGDLLQLKPLCQHFGSSCSISTCIRPANLKVWSSLRCNTTVRRAYLKLEYRSEIVPGGKGSTATKEWTPQDPHSPKVTERCTTEVILIFIFIFRSSESRNRH